MKASFKRAPVVKRLALSCELRDARQRRKTQQDVCHVSEIRFKSSISRQRIEIHSSIYINARLEILVVKRNSSFNKQTISIINLVLVLTVRSGREKERGAFVLATFAKFHTRTLDR